MVRSFRFRVLIRIVVATPLFHFSTVGHSGMITVVVIRLVIRLIGNSIARTWITRRLTRFFTFINQNRGWSWRISLEQVIVAATRLVIEIHTDRPHFGT